MLSRLTRSPPDNSGVELRLDALFQRMDIALDRICKLEEGQAALLQKVDIALDRIYTFEAGQNDIRSATSGALPSKMDTMLHRIENLQSSSEAINAVVGRLHTVLRRYWP